MAAAVSAMTAASALAGVQQCSSPGAQTFQLNRREATRLLSNEVRPSYPPLARINYIGGRVRLLVTVDCQGRVEGIHVVRGHPFLASAALKAIRRWVYRPFVTGSGPAPFQTTVDVDFSLWSRDFQRLPARPEEFLARSVRPPQILQKPAPSGAKSTVRLRVLVNEEGRAVDSTLISGPLPQFKRARNVVRRWKFKPAQWGNLRVPWYLEVDVPVGGGSAASTAARPPAAGEGKPARRSGVQ